MFLLLLPLLCALMLSCADLGTNYCFLAPVGRRGQYCQRYLDFVEDNVGLTEDPSSEFFAQVT